MLLPGTEMHVVTFVFTALETLFFGYELIYYLSRPAEKSRLLFLILLFLLIIYNIAGGLFPDPNIPIPILLQNIIAYGTGFLMAMYFPFYFYKAFNLSRLRFHAYYGIVVFLLLPYLIFFVGVYYSTGDLENVRKMGVVIPFIYSLSLFYSLSRAIIDKHRFKPDEKDSTEITGLYLALIPWMALPIITYFNGSQLLEVTFTNTGVFFLSVMFIRSTVQQSRKDHDRLILSEKMYQQKAMALSKSQNELQNLNETLVQKVVERTRQIEQLNEKKANLFVHLAHETKTPLTLINNSLEEYIEKHGENEELTVIKSNIDKLSKNIVNFFDLEKYTRGFEVYDHQQLSNFSQILIDNLSLFKCYSKKKNITIIERIESNVLAKADPEAINRVVNNLVENAVRHSPEDSTIEVSLCNDGEKIKFTVKDNGDGISSTLQKDIFKPFFQGEVSKRNSTGMGIGLSIVKKIADSLDARIDLVSDPSVQKGTEITIQFKSNINEEEGLMLSYFKVNDKLRFEDPLPEVSDSAVHNPKRSTVFLVEDNLALLAYLSKKLKPLYNVYTAKNGSEALIKLRSVPLPDLIVSDIMMEKLDGTELVKIIAEDEKYQHIPIIFTTARASTKNKLQGLQLGAIDYLAKPYLVSELIYKAEAILLFSQRQRKHLVASIINHKPIDTSSAQPATFSAVNSINVKCQQYGLTAKEIEIVPMIKDGLRNKEIAAKLNISESTVKKHVRNLYEKMDVTSRVELINKLAMTG